MISLGNKLYYEKSVLFIMLACSDNYKHGNLIYSQIVLIDATTNGFITLKNSETNKTCKKQSNILRSMCRALPPLFLHGLPPTPTHVLEGCPEGKASISSSVDHKDTNSPSAQNFWLLRENGSATWRQRLSSSYMWGEIYCTLKWNHYWCSFNNFWYITKTFSL